MLSDDESSGGDELILGDRADSEDSEEDEIVDINSSIEWQETLINNEIPLFKGHAPGPVVTLDASKIELNYFQSFFPEALFQHVVKETNIDELLKYHLLYPIVEMKKNVDEIKQYFGIWIYMSIVQLPTMKLYWLQDELFEGFAIAELKPRDRYLMLDRGLHAVNKEEDDRTDKLVKIRTVYDVGNKCRNNYRPSMNFAIDEAMIKFRGRNTMWYGFKAWVRADSSDGYVNEFHLYEGWENAKTEKSLGVKVVKTLTENLEGLCFHGYIDNYFTSVAGLIERMHKKVYLCRTVKLVAYQLNWNLPKYAKKMEAWNYGS